MATLKPFKAWRPKAEFIHEIASVPYDVINTNEARSLAEGKPLSFLHVIRPEIDLSADTDIYSEAVYQKGKENLDGLLGSDKMIQESEAALYIYRLTWKGSSQTGIFGCVSVDEYDNNIILKHELTRPDKEDDRTKHLVTLQAHPEPVMFTFNDEAGITSLIEEGSKGEPIYDFTADDGVQHTIWMAPNSDILNQAFTNIPVIYVADGHHRCASASRAAHSMRNQHSHDSNEAEYNFFPAVLFPKQEMNILAYNRIVYEIPSDFISRLEETFELEKNAHPIPDKKGGLALYIDGSWYGLTLPETQRNTVADHLDVARLQEFILEPLLNITDPRKDKNIHFVGGIRGTEELERLVDSGEAALGISMFPTSIQELMRVSDEGLLMPPKSTWFEPKLRSGLLIHTF